MIFGRVKPLDAILATAERKSLHRSLGAFQLTLFGIGCIIGTGIFVLTAAGAQKAGPGLMLAFIIAGAVCIVAALCYAEIAAMVPVAGSAYTYSYATNGRIPRLDGRMGVGARICHCCLRSFGRLVWLLQRDHP
jgi:APA family basic amino acid/polyamine antiporter